MTLTQQPNKIEEKRNFAFIDAQNLHIGIKELGWALDYKKFRIYLREHYQIEKAFMFMGYKPREQNLYRFLKACGFVLVFKPILELKNGQVKGNCDAELVLQAMIEYTRYNQAVIVTGDGDFYCLIRYLQRQNKLKRVLAPSLRNCSYLIRKIASEKLNFINELQNRVSYKKRSLLVRTNP